MSPHNGSNASGKTLRPFASVSGLLAFILSLGAALAGVDSARAESPKASTGPSYEETVAYLVDKFQQAGIPGNATHGKHGTTYTVDDTAFSISVEACDSMTITIKTGLHVDDPSESPSRSDSATTTVTKIPFSSISMRNTLDGGRSSSIPVVFSTHTVTTNPNNGQDLADGFGIGAWDMPRFSIAGAGGEWHDAVYFVANDSGVNWKSTGTEIDVSTGQSKPNVPLTVVPFWLPGTGATSTHVAKAIQHLVSICINHSGQVPKEIF
jgi:hypothetical protein